MYIHGLGFHEIGGVPFGGPYNKYYSILGAYIGVPLWGSENKVVAFGGLQGATPLFMETTMCWFQDTGAPQGPWGMRVSKQDAGACYHSTLYPQPLNPKPLNP